MNEDFKAKYKDIWEGHMVVLIEFEGTWIHHHLVDEEGNKTRVTSMIVGDEQGIEIIEGEEADSLVHRH